MPASAVEVNSQSRAWILQAHKDHQRAYYRVGVPSFKNDIHHTSLLSYILCARSNSACEAKGKGHILPIPLDKVGGN